MNNKEIITVIGKDDNINVKNFETLDEFQDFYNLHKNEINNTSTVKLNRIYHIKDYKITRRKNENGGEEKNLYFRRLLKNETSNNNLSDDSQIKELELNISDMRAKIKRMDVEISQLKQQMIEFIKVINSSR